MRNIGRIKIEKENGELLASCNIDGTNNVSAAIDSVTLLPATLDWYRDSTKWLVTLASGVIVLGLGFFKNPTGNNVQPYLFSISGLLLVVSMAAGIFCHFWIASYANGRENISSKGDDDTKGVSVESEKALQSLEKPLKALQLWYYILIWCFFFGALVYFSF